MHYARTLYVAQTGGGIHIRCKHPGCDYTPPEDYTPRVQREAFRQHRIAMGEHPAEPKVTLSVTVDLDVAEALGQFAESAGYSRRIYVRKLLEAVARFDPQIGELNL